ncbi:hypothetical protein BC835DRAFT_1374124 [Cytidiella melzeri]|nr:hypothetical protein BC835DRAFT_1374124 [Cytidiella melzeri]
MAGIPYIVPWRTSAPSLIPHSSLAAGHSLTCTITTEYLVASKTAPSLSFSECTSQLCGECECQSQGGCGGR